MKKLIFLFIFSFSLFLFESCKPTGISVSRLKNNIGFLAADDLKGRGTGTPEERMAADYLAAEMKAAGLSPKGDDGTFFHKFSFHKSTDPHSTVSADGPLVETQNVVGWLDNGSTRTIIIGAHYDHLGLGHDHNSLDANPDGKIHNGADDNASGTAGMLELARWFVKNGKKEQSNFLFIAFSGEELGLIGSKKFTERPTIDLATANFMVNMDMIGRLDSVKKVLVVGGVGTSPTWVPLIDELPHPHFSIKKDSSGIGPSDHTSFYLKNMPVLFVFTGQHSDYHKPGDDIEKINFAGEKSVLKWLVKLIEKADATGQKLVFQETKATKENTPSFKVTLGIMPDYTWEGEGVHVDGVTDGKPGSKAGVLKDDIIVKLGDVDVKNIQDYMLGLSKFKKGDSTKVVIKRGEAKKELPVTFQ